MTRISDRLLVQTVEPDSLVILDEADGSEIVVPMRAVAKVITAMWSLSTRANRMTPDDSVRTVSGHDEATRRTDRTD